jgi:hypothetical protein
MKRFLPSPPLELKLADKLDPKELVSFKELLMSEVIQSEAIINFLDLKKGLFSI